MEFDSIYFQRCQLTCPCNFNKKKRCFFLLNQTYDTSGRCANSATYPLLAQITIKVAKLRRRTQLGKRVAVECIEDAFGNPHPFESVWPPSSLLLSRVFGQKSGCSRISQCIPFNSFPSVAAQYRSDYCCDGFKRYCSLLYARSRAL